MGTKITEKLTPYSNVIEWAALEKIPMEKSFTEELTRDFDVFFPDLEDHLSEEERMVPKLLEEGKFTREEHDAIIQQLIRELGVTGNSLGLPLMLYAMHSWAGTEDLENYMMPNLPGPVKYLYKNSWLPKWRVCVLANFEAVQSNDREKVVLQYQRGGCCGCCSCCVL